MKIIYGNSMETEGGNVYISVVCSYLLLHIDIAQGFLLIIVRI